MIMRVIAFKVEQKWSRRGQQGLESREGKRGHQERGNLAAAQQQKTDQRRIANYWWEAITGSSEDALSKLRFHFI